MSNSRRHRRAAERERRRYGRIIGQADDLDVVMLLPGESCPICDALGIDHEGG